MWHALPEESKDEYRARARSIADQKMREWKERMKSFSANSQAESSAGSDSNKSFYLKNTHLAVGQQQCATETSTQLGHRKGSGIAGNPECVGVGMLVVSVQCWQVCVVCVSVLCGGGELCTRTNTCPPKWPTFLDDVIRQSEMTTSNIR